MTRTICAQGEAGEAIRAALARRIGPQRFNAWFRHGTELSLRDGQLHVGAANPFVAGWIESHFTDDLSAAAGEVLGLPPEVAVSVDAGLAQQLHRRQRDAQARQVSASTEGKTVLAAPPAATPKLRHRLEDFVVGRNNRLAYSAAQSITVPGKAAFNPLFIHGGCGLGKTHLLQGICNAVDQTAGRPVRWKYITAEQFTNDFVEAIRHKKLESFRQTYRQLDLLAIDDVHFLAAKKATQEEFLHTFNAIDAAGKKVILASDAHPSMVGQLAEQLVNRFVSGMVVKIEAPDQETRLAILHKAARKLGIAADGAVLAYVAAAITGSVRELEGALIKLSALAETGKMPITIEMARQGLADHLSRSQSAVTLGDIEAAVATFFGVTPADIHSSSRMHTISLARMTAMFLARRHTRMSFPEIGRFYGKNHSSVVLAVQKMERVLASEENCRWMTAAGPREMPLREILNLLPTGCGLA